MLRFKNYFLAVLFLGFIATSCEKDEKVVIDESKVLVEYLESADSPLMKDFVNSDLPAIMSATDLKTLNETGQVYIIDIRAAADFANGHIANAHNVTVAGIVEHIKTVDLTPYTKVAVVCYSGQTAGYATTLLRLMGYSKAFSLKWGMSSWNTAFANGWKSAIAAGNTYATQFTADVTEKGAAVELPVIETGKTTGQEILEARVADLLTAGYDPAKVSSQTLFANLTNYYIVNYWPAAQYTDPGHIPGAIQYTPKETMKLAVDLKTLPTDKPIAVYCYTGQTSSALVAYLRLLGYDAKSVLYGTNGMIYDIMLAKTMTTFKDAEIMGYEYVGPSTK
jgi:rhodanese-related sulfurtransferase